MMGSAVMFGSREKSGIIGITKMGHQCRDELVGGKTAKLSMFRGNDHIEAPKRHGYLPLMPCTA